MTDRMPPADRGADEELETRLREAFARQRPPAAPEALVVAAERLATRTDERRGIGGWFRLVPLAMATAGIVVAVAFVGSLMAVDPSTTKGDDVPPVSPGTCPVAAIDDPDRIGGPRAFFSRDTLPPAANAAPWKVVVRLAPDIGPGDDVDLTARELDAIADASAEYVGRIGRPQPPLIGGLHLFTQPIPNPGCWQLIVSVNGEVAGSTVIRTVDGARPSSP